MFEIRIDMGVLDELIKRNSEISIIEVLSPRHILGHLFEIIMAIAPFFFLKIIVDLTRLYSQSVKSINQIQNLNLQTLKMENKFLLTQLNPHFLFNTLNNIYALALKKDDLAPKIIVKLSEIMRYTLYDANTDFVPLLKEIDFTENYFEMERMRYSSNYKIEKEVDIRDGANLKIAPLIFFVFVENAFKYGLKSDMPLLKIFIKNSKNNLYFAVINDRLPLNENETFSGGIGLENVKRRLDMIYPERYRLNIIDNEKTFTVELNIEL